MEFKKLVIQFTVEVRENVHFTIQNPKAANIRYKNARTSVLNVFPVYDSLYN